MRCDPNQPHAHEVDTGATGRAFADCASSPRPISHVELRTGLVKCGYCRAGRVETKLVDDNGLFAGIVTEVCANCDGGYVRI